MNSIADPMVANFDVLGALIHQVFEIYQCDHTLVVNMEVNRFVGDKLELMGEHTKPDGRFHSMYSCDILSFSGR